MKRTLSAAGFSLLALTANAAEYGPSTGNARNEPSATAEARIANERNRAEEEYVKAFIHGGNLRAYRLERNRQFGAPVRDEASAGSSRTNGPN